MSPEVVDRGHLSIGEVLALLREEFPDVTISKIRFLESQGLLEPERTPSGYRKFYEADVERLRWILRQQREHFLPLKVIRGRLTGEPAAAEEDPLEVQERTVATRERPAARARAEPARVEAKGAEPARVEAKGDAAGRVGARTATARAAEAEQPGAAQAAAGTGRAAGGGAPKRWEGATGATLTLQELANASSLSVSQLQELERFGLITGRPMAGAVYYDEESMLVANLAAAFLRHGVEARHLRLYKNAADREAGFVEQVVTPLLRQRNPRSRQQALDTIAELSRLGHDLRAALLRQALQELTGH